MRTVGVVTSIILALAAAGVLTPAALSQEPEADAVVEMTADLDFAPPSITISVGDMVEWRNTSRAIHTVTADPELAADAEHVALPGEAGTFNSGQLSPGDGFRHTFTVPGEYRYICRPHEAADMLGTVIVED